MSSTYVAVNNGSSTLGAAVTSATQTSITVALADASKFPAPTGGDYTLITLSTPPSVSPTVVEIVSIVGRTANVLTVGVAGSDVANSAGRGQEGTTANTWILGDVVEVRATAALVVRGGNAKTSAELAAAGGAALVGNTPAGNIAATTVQAAIDELDTEKAQLTTLAAAGGAALVGNTPAGNIAATDVQAALNELDTEKAALAGSASQAFAASSLTTSGTGTGLTVSNANSTTSSQISVAGSMTCDTAGLIAIYNIPTITGGASTTVVYSFQNSPTVTSATATGVRGIQNALTYNTTGSPSIYLSQNVLNLGASALGGTIPAVYGVNVQNATNAAATTNITNFYGVVVGNIVNGALQTITNGYSFHGGMVAAANRWNLYMAGTAINYLNGALLIGTTTDDTVNKLQVTGSANVTGTCSVAAATADGHAVNRITGDGRFAALAGSASQTFSVAAATAAAHAVRLDQANRWNSLSGFNAYDTSQTLTTANKGHYVFTWGANAVVLTLPVASTFAVGELLFIANSQQTGAGTTTLTRAGSDQIYARGGAVTSLSLLLGDSVILTSNGSGQWIVVVDTHGLAALAGSASQTFSVGDATAADHAVRKDQTCITSETPAFSVYANTSPALANITWTKCVLNTKVFDTANAFDATTNYRFQPTVAGYYQINGAVAVTFSANSRAARAALYGSGGVAVKYGAFCDPGTGAVGATTQIATISSLQYLNGSTDYLELWVWGQVNSGTMTTGGGTTYLDGSLVRAA